jgi:hypothetical protein
LWCYEAVFQLLMQTLSAATLLSIWERGRLQVPVQQALLLLDAAHPSLSADELAQLAIGRRDQCLLRLRAWTFGPKIACFVACPACSEQLEFSVVVDDLLGEAAGSPEELMEPQLTSLEVGEYDIRFRLPNSQDVTAVSASEAGESAREMLLERCLVEVRQDGESRSADALPDAVLTTVIDKMADADPLADIQMTLDCPACDHGWRSTLDIASYFWSEIDTWARQTLAEVHALALAYGWREADILSLSAWRRQYYLRMIHG